MRQALNELKFLLDREAQEIRSRNFSRLSAIVRRKNELAATCEAMLADAALGPRSTALMKELDGVQRKAERNAADLLAIKQGFIDARVRLETLMKSETKTGLYGRAGDEIRSAATSAIRRDV
jgi:flagellar biosynthesis/type III secretory pathway chaperone